MSDKILIFCPLECGARIKNLGKHILKCKNYNLLGVKFKKCEYNDAHIIKNELYQIHLLSCKSKKKYEEEENYSDDENIRAKLSDNSENDKNEEKKEEKEPNKLENKIENETKNKNENENEENNINRKRRRYRHERALFKDENEIDKECLDFFNKVYI